MNVENNLEKEEVLSSDNEETDTDECCCYVAVPCGCGCDSCELDEEDYCC